MDQTKCCNNGDKCTCSQGKSCGIMERCSEHKSSKEHLEMKKKFLEERLQWVNEELNKTE